MFVILLLFVLMAAQTFEDRHQRPFGERQQKKSESDDEDAAFRGSSLLKKCNWIYKGKKAKKLSENFPPIHFATLERVSSIKTLLMTYYNFDNDTMINLYEFEEALLQEMQVREHSQNDIKKARKFYSMAWEECMIPIKPKS